MPARVRACFSPPSPRGSTPENAPGTPAILIPNPFYAAYGAGAAAAQCEAHLPAGDCGEPDSCPISIRCPTHLLARTVAFYLASPANPQGSVADAAYLARLIGLARRFGFMLFADECYSEIYSTTPPPGALEHAGPDYANVVVFNSLSKRSNLAGLRVGFAAGDRNFLDRFIELRNVSAPQVPMPAQAVAIAAYGDEAHVEENRALYNAKFDLADQIHRRPLWLQASGRRFLSLARCLRPWRRRSGHAEAVARSGCARPPRRLRFAHRRAGK